MRKAGFTDHGTDIQAFIVQRFNIWLGISTCLWNGKLAVFTFIGVNVRLCTVSGHKYFITVRISIDFSVFFSVQEN